MQMSCMSSCLKLCHIPMCLLYYYANVLHALLSATMSYSYVSAILLSKCPASPLVCNFVIFLCVCYTVLPVSCMSSSLQLCHIPMCLLYSIILQMSCMSSCLQLCNIPMCLYAYFTVFVLHVLLSATTVCLLLCVCYIVMQMSCMSYSCVC